MNDEFYGTGSPRKWTFEEIDELLQDSGIASEKDFEPEQLAPTINKSESVDPRPIYNEDIDHKIKTTAVEKSAVDGKTRQFSALESDKYRDRFLNKPMHNLQKTAEHKFIPAEEQPYERSGFVKKASPFKGTKELEPVPILVSDDLIREEQQKQETTKEIRNSKTIGLRSLAVTNGDAEETELIIEDDDMQLSFAGFNTEEVEIVDEEEVERELLRKRRKLVSEFVVSTEPEAEPTEDDSNAKFGLDEYRNVNDKSKVELNLKRQEKKATVSTGVAFVCFILLVVLSLVAGAIYEPNSLVHKSEFPVIFLNFVITVVAIVNCKGIFLDGLKSIKGFNFNRNSGCAIALVVALLQNFSFFFAMLPFENKLSLYSAVAVLPLVFNSFATLLEARRLRMNFAMVTKKELYSISHIERKETAFEIGRGLLLDEPIILASQKTKFPGRFLELSKKYYPSDEFNKKSVPVTLGVALIVGVITTIISKNAFNGISAFTAIVAISAPCFSFLCDNMSINKLAARLRKRGSVITGWEANRMCAVANGITVDSTDVFDREGGNVFGIKTFHSMKVDEAILNTGAMVVASGGALGNLFRRIIVDRVELLPPVDTLAYEDKLGLSAWIQNRRVLVGSYDLLRNHNVEVPDKALIAKYTHDDRYPLFLAIEGKLAAMFIISYDVNQENAKYLRRIEKESISLLLRNDDANVTDNMVAKMLSVPNSGVKVLSAVSGDILNSYKNEVRTAGDAALMHNGDSSSYLYAVASALSLEKAKRFISVLQTGAIAVGIAFAATLAFISGGAELSIIPLIITQLVFSVISIFKIRLR